SAFARLAVPAHGKVRGLGGLHLMNHIQDHHAFFDLGGVVFETAPLRVPSPDPQCYLPAHFCSSIACLRSSRIGGRASRPRVICPSVPSFTTRLNVANSARLSGKSSRKCPPRLSLRSIAASVMASETVSRLSRSSAVCQPGLYSRWPVTPQARAR